MKAFFAFYGTLRPDCGDRVSPGLELIGYGTIPARIFLPDGEDSWFPGIELSDYHRTKCAIMACEEKDESRLLSGLDRYEGCNGESGLYFRRKVPAVDEAGKEYNCWVYVMNPRHIARKVYIESGDWVEHYGRKN